MPMYEVTTFLVAESGERSILSQDRHHAESQEAAREASRDKYWDERFRPTGAVLDFEVEEGEDAEIEEGGYAEQVQEPSYKDMVLQIHRILDGDPLESFQGWSQDEIEQVGSVMDANGFSTREVGEFGAPVYHSHLSDRGEQVYLMLPFLDREEADGAREAVLFTTEGEAVPSRQVLSPDNFNALRRVDPIPEALWPDALSQTIHTILATLAAPAHT